MISGLSQNTTALDLLQSTTEGVYHRLAAIADLSLPAKKGSDSPVTQIIVSGGVLKSAHLLQRLADVLGRPVSPSLEPEASLRGAAVYAIERIDESGAVAELPPEVGPAVRPRARYASRYLVERKRQQRLERLMSSLG